MSRIIREARQTDVAEIMQVMDAAKKIMRQSGNMHQWGEGYPSEAVITADMERNGGFIIEDDGCIVGYFAFLPSPEPTYAKIYEGQVSHTEDYSSSSSSILHICLVVFLASFQRGKNLSISVWKRALWLGSNRWHSS